MGSLLSYDIYWRIKEVNKFKNKPFYNGMDYESIQDKYVKSYLKFLNDELPDKEARVWDDVVYIAKNPNLRLPMELLAISGTKDSDIASFFGVSSTVVKFYKKMFFDIDPIKRSKAKLLEIAQNKIGKTRTLYLAAVKYGSAFVKIYLGVDRVNEKEILGLLQMLNNSILAKGLNHEFIDMNSELYSKIFLKLFSLIDKIFNKKEDGKGSKEDINEVYNRLQEIFNREEHDNG